MRLMTHNLMCCLKCKHFPLDISASDIQIAEQTYDRDFTQRMLGRCEYEILVTALEQVREGNEEEMANIPKLPATIEEIDFENDAVVASIHMALSAVTVRNGALTCPQCTTVFPITEFIPNLMVE